MMHHVRVERTFDFIFDRATGIYSTCSIRESVFPVGVSESSMVDCAEASSTNNVKQIIQKKYAFIHLQAMI